MSDYRWALWIITFFWRDWIRLVFRVDTDRRSGSMEWLIAAALLAASLVSAFLAAVEWHKIRAPLRSGIWEGVNYERSDEIACRRSAGESGGA